MIARIWRAAGGTTLTFWSLTISAILFFVGAIHADNEFELFARLNETRIQDWMAANLPGHLAVSWWLPLLLVSLLFLGLNTVACLVQRFNAILAARRGMSTYALARELAPTIIHALFAVVMAGHLVTISMGEWRRFPVVEGGMVALAGPKTALRIDEVRDELFPAVPGQPPRIAQTHVSLSSRAGEILTLAHGAPAAYEGFHLILDREKKRRDPAPAKEVEDCNREGGFGVEKKARPAGPTILAVADPGVPIIFTAFTLILLLMGWYFATAGRQR